VRARAIHSLFFFLITHTHTENFREKSKEVIKELRKSESFDQPIQVIIKEGMYNLAETLVFGPEDSGAKGSELIFLAARKDDQKWVL
jgi:translation initiation factor IF-2